jgi:NAD(P)-dependent dehydrogenase (short-subunit alcohol dehydrogenase family)
MFIPIIGDTMSAWTAADVPGQDGRTVVVTGANTGLGFETAKVLADRGATVVLACRNPAKAGRAVDRLGGGPRLSVVELDLASLASVRHAADEIRAAHPRLDLLINNAGLMSPTPRQTADGFELQFGTNHLGHFALTGLLIDRLRDVPGSRVVTVSSIAHRRARIDLPAGGRYRWGRAYGQSKLANLMFTYELQRRLAAAGAGTIAVAAHPGNAQTELIRHFPRQQRIIGHPRMRWATSWLFQSAPMGALATLRAAADPEVRGGSYYGPPGRLQFTGAPSLVRSSERSYDTGAQRRLWADSERMTGVTYPL